MTEHDELVPKDAGGASIVMPTSGDPSLELFGHGWTPDHGTTTDADSYRGRHRAEDY